MRHAEVVAFVKKGGDETWLLVVDPDTDEHFKRKGVVPSVSHLKGRTTQPKCAVHAFEFSGCNTVRQVVQ